MSLEINHLPISPLPLTRDSPKRTFLFKRISHLVFFSSFCACFPSLSNLHLQNNDVKSEFWTSGLLKLPRLTWMFVSGGNEHLDSGHHLCNLGQNWAVRKHTEHPSYEPCPDPASQRYNNQRVQSREAGERQRERQRKEIQPFWEEEVNSHLSVHAALLRPFQWNSSMQAQNQYITLRA